MEITFIIKSSTVNLKNYTIKDIQASSKRLDVVARCILSALIDDNRFHLNHRILVFLDNHGGFEFNPKVLDFDSFPRNELLLCDNFVKLIRGIDDENNPLRSVRKIKIKPIDSINDLIKDGFQSYVMAENGISFEAHIDEISKNNKLLFIIGSQTGEFINSEAIKNLALTYISFGEKSYLASQVIRLIKIMLTRK